MRDMGRNRLSSLKLGCDAKRFGKYCTIQFYIRLLLLLLIAKTPKYSLITGTVVITLSYTNIYFAFMQNYLRIIAGMNNARTSAWEEFVPTSQCLTDHRSLVH